jgi:hypothetical protein
VKENKAKRLRMPTLLQRIRNGRHDKGPSLDNDGHDNKKNDRHNQEQGPSSSPTRASHHRSPGTSSIRGRQLVEGHSGNVRHHHPLSPFRLWKSSSQIPAGSHSTSSSSSSTRGRPLQEKEAVGNKDSNCHSKRHHQSFSSLPLKRDGEPSLFALSSNQDTETMTKVPSPRKKDHRRQPSPQPVPPKRRLSNTVKEATGSPVSPSPLPHKKQRNSDKPRVVSPSHNHNDDIPDVPQPQRQRQGSMVLPPPPPPVAGVEQESPGTFPRRKSASSWGDAEIEDEIASHTASQNKRLMVLPRQQEHPENPPPQQRQWDEFSIMAETMLDEQIGIVPPRSIMDAVNSNNNVTVTERTESSNTSSNPLTIFDIPLPFPLLPIPVVNGNNTTTNKGPGDDLLLHSEVPGNSDDTMTTLTFDTLSIASTMEDSLGMRVEKEIEEERTEQKHNESDIRSHDERHEQRQEDAKRRREKKTTMRTVHPPPSTDEHNLAASSSATAARTSVSTETPPRTSLDRRVRVECHTLGVGAVDARFFQKGGKTLLSCVRWNQGTTGHDDRRQQGQQQQQQQHHRIQVSPDPSPPSSPFPAFSDYTRFKKRQKRHHRYFPAPSQANYNYHHNIKDNVTGVGATRKYSPCRKHGRRHSSPSPPPPPTLPRRSRAPQPHG